MNRVSPLTTVLGCLAVLLVFASPTMAQDYPWASFTEPSTGALCDIINAANAELVLDNETAQLIVVTAADATIADSYVDENLNVYFQNEPVGQIAYATDGDNLRSLWWVDFTGQVVELNGFTGEPAIGETTPADYRDVPCDACDFWDDQTICADRDDTDDDNDSSPPSLNLCGSSVPLAMLLSFAGLTVMRFTQRRR
jgi:hypothetical protein